MRAESGRVYIKKQNEKGCVILKLTGKSLRSDFARFVSATTASLMVFCLYSVVDGLMVARGVGEYAMSAVNLALPFTNLLFAVAVMFAVGSSTIIAIFMAQKKKREADELLSQNLTVLIIMGVVITAVLIFTEPIARLLGANDVTLDYTVDYLKGLAPFSAFFLISYNLEILIKTDGFPQTALITVIIGCLSNCVMDYVAIFILDMGTYGAAFATGLSQLITSTIYIVHFLGGRCSFKIRKFRFDPHIYKRLIPIGFADGITELCTGVMMFIFNRTVLHYIGNDGVVTYTIIAYVNTVVINLMMGVSQGSQPLISFYYGEGSREKCNTLLKYGVRTVTAMAAIVFVGLYICANQVVGIFLKDSDPGLIDFSVKAFRTYSFSYIILGFNVLIGGFMTALERPRQAIAISIGRGLVLQSISLMALSLSFGADGIWYTPILSEAMCLIMSMLFLRQYLKNSEIKTI